MAHTPVPEIWLECSVLGAGRREPSCRTGIHRYIRELAVALQQLPAAARLRPFCNDPRWLIDTLEAVGELELDSSFLERQIPPTGDLWHRALPQRVRWRAKRLLTGWGLTPFQRRTSQLMRVAMAMGPEGRPPLMHDPHLRSVIRGYGQRPRVCTVHDLVPLLHPQWCDDASAKLYQRSFRALQPWDCIAAVSQATLNDLLRCCPQIRPERCQLTPLAASPLFSPVDDPDLQRQARQAAGLPLHSPYLLTLSTLEPRKNLTAVVRAYGAAAARLGRDALPELVMIGQSGWKVGGLSREIAASGLGSRIRCTGYLADAMLPALYSGALGFLYPSLHEGFGLPVLEAMQCGTPVITSNSSSLAEISGDAALLVDPHNHDALAEALVQLLLKPELRAELAQSGLRRAAQFSWRRCAEATASLYALALPA